MFGIIEKVEVMKCIKGFLPVCGLAALVFSANGIKETTNSVNAGSTKVTNTYSELGVSATKTRLNNLGISVTSLSIFRNKYAYLPGFYESKINDTTIVSMYRLETNLKRSYTEFTGYIFKHSEKVANTSIYLSEFTSQTIKVSAAFGVYASASYVMNSRVEESIGCSLSARHTVSVNRTFSINGKTDGYYGLMMDFYTCDRLYLKFSNGELIGSILSKNNPSNVTDYHFVQRSV